MQRRLDSREESGRGRFLTDDWGASYGASHRPQLSAVGGGVPHHRNALGARLFFQQSRGRQSVEAGHRKVHHNDVRTIDDGASDGMVWVRGHVDTEAMIPQGSADAFKDIDPIVDDQHHKPDAFQPRCALRGVRRRHDDSSKGDSFCAVGCRQRQRQRQRQRALQDSSHPAEFIVVGSEARPRATCQGAVVWLPRWSARMRGQCEGVRRLHSDDDDDEDAVVFDLGSIGSTFLPSQVAVCGRRAAWLVSAMA